MPERPDFQSLKVRISFQKGDPGNINAVRLVVTANGDGFSKTDLYVLEEAVAMGVLKMLEEIAPGAASVVSLFGIRDHE